ncbi:NAD(P)-binding Rossmann-fold superfamily protein [Striga asiatica]|uniref:NAD(P)-binding Rossmann-fold superfamily protein n=1 Tax=Striga asiatica TaxID=4170 RepID=A0A5A7PJG3_STRAF|nr:NAD(P)-binding Rossmann-fold superfamily protein [Striga asiatica]
MQFDGDVRLCRGDPLLIVTFRQCDGHASRQSLMRCSKSIFEGCRSALLAGKLSTLQECFIRGRADRLVHYSTFEVGYTTRMQYPPEMGKKERAQERRERRRQEIALLRAIPYSDQQRWWTPNTIAVVTGSNRGIGFEIARQLASNGLTVIVTSREITAGEAAVKVLKEEGLNVVSHQLDILDPSSIETFVQWTKETYGSVDILVNNAGVNFNTGSDNSIEFAEKVVATNFYGTKNMIKAMIPLMRPSHSGARIVNVSSRLGRLNGRRNRIGNIDLRKKLEDDESLSEDLIDQTMATFLEQVKDGSWENGGWPQVYTDYSLSKLAVNAYTRMIARRLDGQKIYINCCCPGWVKTGMTDWAGLISPEEGADTAVWLALLSDQLPSGKFFAERREINF